MSVPERRLWVLHAGSAEPAARRERPVTGSEDAQRAGEQPGLDDLNDGDMPSTTPTPAVSGLTKETISMSEMRGTGGNQFYDGDMGRNAFLSAVMDGVRALEDWCEGDDREVDYGALSVETKRVNGRISVSVTGDLTTHRPGDVRGTDHTKEAGDE